MDVQPNDPAPQQETPTRVVDRVTEHTIRFETWVGYNSTWKYFKVRASCHVPCCSTPALLCSRTHRTVPVQMWMDETKSSFEMAKAKIDGRDISYPYLLDAKGEPRLQCTNAFMIWFCERCDIVVKKTVVEKAESWLMACGNLSRVKFDPNGPGLTKGIFTQAMLVKVAIKSHQEAYGLHSIASGKEVAARAVATS